MAYEGRRQPTWPIALPVETLVLTEAWRDQICCRLPVEVQLYRLTMVFTLRPTLPQELYGYVALRIGAGSELFGCDLRVIHAAQDGAQRLEVCLPVTSAVVPDGTWDLRIVRQCSHEDDTFAGDLIIQQVLLEPW